MPLSDSKFSVLVSFAYNVDMRAFERSTLLSLLNKAIYLWCPRRSCAGLKLEARSCWGSSA